MRFVVVAWGVLGVHGLWLGGGYRDRGALMPCTMPCGWDVDGDVLRARNGVECVCEAADGRGLISGMRDGEGWWWWWWEVPLRGVSVDLVLAGYRMEQAGLGVCALLLNQRAVTVSFLRSV